jgi:2-amino-4-hydroxy-6-hydroxymethyldihydropteridine diphosphokinase
MNTVYLLLGSNLGDKAKNLDLAIEQIKHHGQVILKSSLYSSKAWGKTNQPDFINQAIEVQTTQSPEELLKELLSIETLLGRQRIEKWGERLIDIDILFYGDRTVSDPHLHIPHPEIQNRRFALMPMVELAPGFRHPILKKTMKELLEDCLDPLPVDKML